MLVVSGIIVVPIGLAARMITRAWRAGDRAATFADLQAIATALEAYRQDHGDYPRVREDPSIPKNTGDYPNPPTGAQILCQALIAPAPESEYPAGTPPPAGPTRRLAQSRTNRPGSR